MNHIFGFHEDDDDEKLPELKRPYVSRLGGEGFSRLTRRPTKLTEPYERKYRRNGGLLRQMLGMDAVSRSTEMMERLLERKKQDVERQQMANTAGQSSTIPEMNPTSRTYPSAQINPPRQTYPTQQTYPAQQTYPTQQSYPAQQTYPAGQVNPPRQTYPAQQSYPAPSVQQNSGYGPGERVCQNCGGVSGGIYCEFCGAVL